MCDAACADETLASCVVECSAPLEITATMILSPVVLICLSALFSGLTLGLMSLDTTGLEIIIAGGKEPDKSRAEKILPLRKKGNQLLCTLLLSNTLVNALLAILMGDMTSGVIGGLLATGIIVVFGEIIPQATCSRHALLVGSICIEPVRLCMLILTPVTLPMSMVLDYMLGHEITAGRTKRELEHLLHMQETTDHHTAHDGMGGSPSPRKEFITTTEKKLLGGALKLSEKAVHDVMTSFDNIFMIDNHGCLDFRTLREIYRSGYTRVPVYEDARNNLIGVLNTKDLVLVDADDELPISEIMAACGRPIFTVQHDMPLDQMLTKFKESRTHLALVQVDPSSPAKVRREAPVDGGEEAGAGQEAEEAGPESAGSALPGGADPRAAELRPAPPDAAEPAGVEAVGYLGYPEAITVSANGASVPYIVGIVTLEDVLEELLQAEIVDENDRVEDNVTLRNITGRLKELADRRFAFLDMLQHQPRSLMMSTSVGPKPGAHTLGEIKMTSTELAAVCSFLAGNAPQFSPEVMSSDMLLTLIMQCRVCDVLPGTPAALICLRGAQCSVAYLVLQGRVRVVAGSEAFKTELGPWTLLAGKSLDVEDYCPDFTATIVEHARLLLISGASYRQLAINATDMKLASQMIRLGQEHSDVGWPSVERSASTNAPMMSTPGDVALLTPAAEIATARRIVSEPGGLGPSSMFSAFSAGMRLPRISHDAPAEEEARSSRDATRNSREGTHQPTRISRNGSGDHV